jgi:enterochelin esterase-like enzyme
MKRPTTQPRAQRYVYLAAVALTLTLSACTTSDQAHKSNPKFGMPTAPTAAQLSLLEQQWVDPVSETSAPNTSYRLYDTPSRGAHTQGSYLIYQPNLGENNKTRFPVIYWLHGGMGNQREAEYAITQMHQDMLQGKMPPAIIVAPQALPTGWYVNSWDGQRPIENVLIRDLLPHIDKNYPTLTSAKYRALEGMSMGGYGALRLALTHPDLFGAASAYAPSILRTLSDEPSYRTASTFNASQALFAQLSPWQAMIDHADTAHKNGLKIQIVTGGKDERLNQTLTQFSTQLNQYKISSATKNAPTAGHNYQEIRSGLADPSQFWRDMWRAASPQSKPSAK